MFQESIPKVVPETNQPTGEPSEGIDTSPTIFRPWVLCTHDKHVANYIRIMVKSGMSLSMGEDWSVPLVMEVLSLPSPYAFLIPSSILLLVLLFIAIYSLITASVFNQALQKIRLANHIHSLVELLDSDAIQQLELARVLDVLVMGTQYQTTSLHSTSVPVHPSVTSSMPSSSPSVPIAGITDMEGPAEAKASTSKTLPPTTSADIEAGSPKHHWIILVLIPTTASRSSSIPSKLPVIVVPELAVPVHALPEQINCPGGCKDYRCQLCAFQHTNKDCILTHIQQHLEILIGCPMCGKGFQNVASLHKHRKKVHSIHIMEMENE